ncbi:MAG TPA: tetratricopeptide repeat protein [Spirochaetota bacterium]|nr:tetratricopeptide repeat protein [Spirochaetota bacterium]
MRGLVLFLTLISAVFPALYADTPQEINRRGAELGKQNKYDEAMQEFSKASEIYNKESAKYYHNKAWALELQGKNDEAVKFYEKALERNPSQADSIERLGYHHYRKGEYDKAVELGEKAAGINPRVPYLNDWLPEAYRLNLLAKSSEPGKVINEEIESEEEPQAESEKKENAFEYFGFSFDLSLRYGRNVRGGRPYYIKSESKTVNLPFSLNMWFRPNDFFMFSMKAENPYWGASVDRAVSQQEFLEGMFSIGSFSLGCGLWFTHYTEDFVFESSENLNDCKMGILMSYSDDKSETNIRLYPRLFLRDTEKFSDGRTLDCGMYEFAYSYTVHKALRYYSRISQYDFYLFDHDAVQSHYWGFFEIAIGLSLDYKSGSLIKGGSIYIEYAKRINLRKLNEDEPYNTFNGQGFLGFDSSKDPSYFSGQRSRSHILRMGASEKIDSKSYLYQKLILEIVDRHEDHQELLLGFGGGINL